MSRFHMLDPKLPAVLTGLLGLVATGLVACAEKGPVDPADEPLAAELPDGLLVSNPMAADPLASLLDGSATKGQYVVYVSAKPGTFEDATHVEIRNVSSDDPGVLSVPIVDGGFDPVAVPAHADDELELTIRMGDVTVAVLYVSVVPSRPPVVVRTSPSKGRTDVALSAQPIVVFSEPIDPGTVTDASVQLRRDGSAVAAAVGLIPESPFTARLVPDALLQPSTAFELVVSTAIHDLEDNALEKGVNVAFTTRPVTPSLSIVSGNGQQGRVGTPLPDSFVARVSDIDGTALDNVLVVWESYGKGALDGFAADGSPIDRLETRTNADGLARALLIPTVFDDFPTEARLTRCADDCGGPSVIFGTDASDPGATLTVVSGDLQTADAGQPSAPLVARLTDSQGDPVQHATVRWERAYGQASFFPDSLWGDVSTRTDVNGFTEQPVVPLWFGPVDVEAYVSGWSEPGAVFRIDASDPGASIVVESGDAQVGKANEALGEPLVVRVTNGRGDPVERVRLEWSGEPSWGSSIFEHRQWWHFGDSGSLGLVAGFDSVYFTPRALGTVWAVARLPGIPSREVRFTAQATVFVIELLPFEDDNVTAVSAYFTENSQGDDCWWWDCFVDTENRVPPGSPLEWVNRLPSARIVSTSVPPGGASFDSGSLSRDERFTFVPGVAGTWEYVDQVSGARAVLTVY